MGHDATGLSKVEREVLRRVVGLEDNETIAVATGLPVTQVKAHLRAIYRHLGLKDRAELMSWWVEHGPTL